MHIVRNPLPGRELRLGIEETRPGCHGRTLVLAVGNRAAGDDGFGPVVLERLRALEPPGRLRLADGGTLGVDLLSEIEDLDRLIVVDAVRVRDETEDVGRRGRERAAVRSPDWVVRPDPVPGGVVVFRLREVELDDPDPRFSLHDLSLGGTLRLARMLDLPIPEILVVGFPLGPATTLDGPRLSDAAAVAVGQAVDAVLRLTQTAP